MRTSEPSSSASAPESHSTKTLFWEMAAAEPFRIFFPLGVLVGISGVSLWPLFFTGIHHSFYPGVMHARMMIEGFLGAFILGFLGTAVPRLTDGAPLSKRELFTILGMFAAAIGTHIAERYLAADILFFLLLVTFAGLLGRRIRRSNELPPPSFVLVGCGYLMALAGTGLLIVGGWGIGVPYVALLGSTLLYQGFVLCMVLGVAGYLLPRILRIPQPEKPRDASLTPKREWMKRAFLAALAGALLLASFVIETFTTWDRSAALIRFAVAAMFLFSGVPIRSSDVRGTIARCVKLSLVLLLFGLAFPVFWPEQRVAGLHAVFMGGFTLLTFAVATRVILGHSGQDFRFQERHPFLLGTTVLLLLSGIMRIGGDFTPAVRGSVLSHASYLWILAAAVWGWRVLPWVRRADSME